MKTALSVKLHSDKWDHGERRDHAREEREEEKWEGFGVRTVRLALAFPVHTPLNEHPEDGFTLFVIKLLGISAAPCYASVQSNSIRKMRGQ